MFKKVNSSVVLGGIGLFWFFHFLLIYNTSFQLSKIWFWNFAAYFTPSLILLELFLFIFFLIKKEYRIALIPFVLILFSWDAITDTIQFHSPATEKGKNPLTVLSYNTSLIPYESVSDSIVLDTNVSNGLFQLLEKESPDVLCLQEFHHEDYENMDVLNQLNEVFGYQYYVMAPVFSEKFRGYSGPIVLSKHPIVRDYHIKFKKGGNNINHLIAVDIAVGKDTIRVINVHLKSMTIRLSQSLFENISDIYSRLKVGFQAQSSQVEESYEYVKNSPHRVIFCGDFNSLPYSYTYQFLQNHLTNTFDKRGRGFGYTLNRFPHFVRIDNVFVSNDIDVTSHRVLKEYQQSDHFPVLVGLDLGASVKH